MKMLTYFVPLYKLGNMKSLLLIFFNIFNDMFCQF